MVKCKTNQLVIKINTPIPEETLEGIKLGITYAIQAHFRDEIDMDKDLMFGNYFLLELLAELNKKEW